MILGTLNDHREAVVCLVIRGRLGQELETEVQTRSLSMDGTSFASEMQYGFGWREVPYRPRAPVCPLSPGEAGREGAEERESGGARTYRRPAAVAPSPVLAKPVTM